MSEVDAYDDDGSGRFRVRIRPVIAAGVAVVALILAGLGGVRLLTASNEEVWQTMVEAPANATKTGEENEEGAVTVGTGLSLGYALEESEETEEQSRSPTVIAHVTGAVRASDVVELPAGSRVVDAVEAAGGLTEDADASAVNLAAFVTDGSQVHIPRVGEVAVAPTSSGTSAGDGSAGDECVDLNTASDAELQTLDGVGPKIAARILEFREANGRVESASDLTEVSGIGTVLAERIGAGTCQ